MGWVDRHKRRGAWLAFAALALQIVLSFGHVHLDGIRPVAAHNAVVAPHKVAVAVAVADASRQTPLQNSGDDDDYCAICASIYLVSTTFISDAPVLPVPLGFERIVHSYANTRGSLASRRVAFRSRAPPSA
jgi:hypothetical protein